jgi:hypothetical protein
VACDEAGELARIGEGRGGGAASPLSLAAGAVKTKGVERRGWVGSGVLVVSLSSPVLSLSLLRVTPLSRPFPFLFTKAAKVLSILAYLVAEIKRLT